MDPGESGGSGPSSTYSTCGMELGESQRIGHIAARRPTVRLWARRPHEPGKGAVPERGACNDLYAFRRASAWSVPSKGRPPCRELLAVVQGPQTLRHGDRLVGPELSLLAHRVLDALRRHFHEDAALQHRARVRVEDLVKRALKPFEVRRANLRHVLWKKTHKFAPLSGRSTTWWPTSGG